MRKMQIANIFRCRRDNYAWYFAERESVKALPPTMQETYRLLTSRMPHPVMNIFGKQDFDYEKMSALVLFAINQNVDNKYIDYWIASEEGWQDYVKQFNDLPDPVEIPLKSVHNPLCTTRNNLCTDRSCTQASRKKESCTQNE